MTALIPRNSVLSSLTTNLSWPTSIAAILSVLVVSRILKFVRGVEAVGSLPGLYVPFQPFSVFGALLPEAWWNPGLLFTWRWRKKKNLYHLFGSDTISIVPFIGGAPSIYTRSLEVGKQIVVAGQRSGAFGKSEPQNRFFLFWGPNIISAEGELWRKHRKITSPSFNNDTYAFVWDASHKLYAEMTSVEGWNTKDVVEVPCVQDFTSKFTLTIFASVGFGIPFTWANPPAQQGEMSIQESMEIITKTMLFAISAPSWMWRLPLPWIQRRRRAYDTMRAFMRTLVSDTREKIRSEAANNLTERGRDLFTLLVRASEDIGGKMGLNDNELIGNVFSFLFAGHETTAQSLAATLAFLALYPNLQDEVVAQVQEVTQGRDDDTLLFEDYGKLDKMLAAFYEGTRMFPSGVFLVREALQDTVLDISSGNKFRSLNVKKGTTVVVDMVGIEYHPQYLSDPEEFRPSRWYRRQKDDNERDSLEEYTAFSIGPRACLGRKFASTEGVCFLALLLREWRVEPLLAVDSNGRVESVDEWRGRVLQATLEVTLGIKDVPLRLVRR